MSRYIDAEAVLKKMDDFCITAIIQQKMDDVSEEHRITWSGMGTGVNYARNVIIDCPTADVVEVVRCKDCVHYESYHKPVEDFDGKCFARCCETDEQDFCNYGKRKTN